MKKILVTGGELFNKGAQAMTYATVDSLRKNFKNCKICLISERDNLERSYLEKSVLKFEIISQKTTPATILYKSGGLYKLIKLIRKVSNKALAEMDEIYKDTDYMIDISGYALGSNRGNKNSIAYILRIMLAKAYGIKMYIMPQSMGPFDYKGIMGFFIKFFIRKYLKYPEKIFVREKSGYDLLVNKYKLKNVVYAHDIVLTNKHINLENVFYKHPRISIPEIVPNSVCILPNMRNYEHSNKEELMRLYEKIVNKLLSLGKTIYLARHAVEDIEFCKDIKQMFGKNDNVVLLEQEFSCFEYNELVKKFDYIIASRFHSIVHAYKNAVLSIAIGWADKYVELAELFGQAHNVFDIRKSVNETKIIEAVDAMNNEYKELSARIAERMAEIQKEDVFKIFKPQKGANTVAEMDRNLCVSCGVCSAVCPQKCIESQKVNGQYLPQVNAEKCMGCGICVTVCSSCGENYDTYSKYSQQESEDSLPICYNIWAKDGVIRKNSVSGGIITLLAGELIKSREYSCVFCVDDFKYCKEVFTKRFTGNLENTSKSRYIPVSHKNAIEYILRNRKEKVILIATPCVVHNILNVIETFKLNRDNYLLLGLFCDKTERNSIFDYFQSQSLKNISELHFRNKEKIGWPGNVKIKYSDGSEEFKPASERMKVKSYFQLERCLYCIDKLNEFCDISIGDNYTQQHGKDKVKGENSIIIRTRRGLNAFNQINAETEKQEISYEEIYNSQNMNMRKQNAIYAAIYEKNTGADLYCGYLKREVITKKTLKEYKKAIKKLEIGKRYPNSANELKRDLNKDNIKKKYIYVKSIMQAVRRKLGLK